MRSVAYSLQLFLMLLGFPGISSAGDPKPFVDITKASGVTDAIARHYEKHPKWWMSGVNLVDLDGDGKLDLFLAAHGAGAPLALLNDGHGKFIEAPGSYPSTEIHLAYDINEDGKLDLQMTFQDGGAKWWINQSQPGRLAFLDSGITASQGRANAMVHKNVKADSIVVIAEEENQ
jgi:hypothetical protein